jgi:hypothetical protein
MPFASSSRLRKRSRGRGAFRRPSTSSFSSSGGPRTALLRSRSWPSGCRSGIRAPSDSWIGVWWRDSCGVGGTRRTAVGSSLRRRAGARSWSNFSRPNTTRPSRSSDECSSLRPAENDRRPLPEVPRVPGHCEEQRTEARCSRPIEMVASPLPGGGDRSPQDLLETSGVAPPRRGLPGSVVDNAA